MLRALYEILELAAAAAIGPSDLNTRPVGPLAAVNALLCYMTG